MFDLKDAELTKAYESTKVKHSFDKGVANELLRAFYYPYLGHPFFHPSITGKSNG
jgi:hypothetical protein